MVGGLAGGGITTQEVSEAGVGLVLPGWPGWRQEVRDLGTNIRVAAISPGLVETEFQTAMYPDAPEKAEAIVRSVECLQDRDISSAVSYILASPPHMQIHDLLIRPTQQKF